MSDIKALHNKVKTSTAEITSIDAVQLSTQQIVITVTVAFKQVSLQVIQTLVLEAQVIDEVTNWFIENDMTRFLPLAQASRERAPKSANAKATKSVKSTPAKPVEAEPAVAAAEVTVQTQSAPVAVVPEPVVVAATPVAAPAAVVAPVQKQKTERPAKKASAVTNAAPAVEKPKEAEKPVVPKSWAGVVSAKPAATVEPVAAVPVVKPIEKKVIHPIAVLVAPGPGAVAAAASSNATGELHVFARTSKGPVNKEAAQAKFAEFAPVKEIEFRAASVIVSLTTTDADGLLATLKAHTPFLIDTLEFTLEASRTPPRAPGQSSAPRNPSTRRTNPRQSSSSPAPKKD